MATSHIRHYLAFPLLPINRHVCERPASISGDVRHDSAAPGIRVVRLQLRKVPLEPLIVLHFNHQQRPSLERISCDHELVDRARARLEQRWQRVELRELDLRDREGTINMKGAEATWSIKYHDIFVCTRRATLIGPGNPKLPRTPIHPPTT